MSPASSMRVPFEREKPLTGPKNPHKTYEYSSGQLLTPLLANRNNQPHPRAQTHLRGGQNNCQQIGKGYVATSCRHRYRDNRETGAGPGSLRDCHRDPSPVKGQRSATASPARSRFVEQVLHLPIPQSNHYNLTLHFFCERTLSGGTRWLSSARSCESKSPIPT